MADGGPNYRPIAGAIDLPWRPNENRPNRGVRRPGCTLSQRLPATRPRLRRTLPLRSPAGDVAAVLLRLPEADERTLLTHIKALAPRVQESGTALLLDGRPDLVARAGADGAHLTGVEAFAAAVPTLEAGPHCRLRRHSQPARRHGRGRDGCRLRDVRRAGRRRPPAVASTPSSSVSPGGRKCSRFPASAMPARSTRSGRCRRPAPISSRSATASSPMHAASRPPSATRWHVLRSRRRSDEQRDRRTRVSEHWSPALTASRDCRRARAGAPRSIPRRRRPCPRPRRSRRRASRPRPRSHRRPPAGGRTPAPRAEPDDAFGAYQRGYYLTAFQSATQRVEEKGDPQGDDALGGALCQRLRRRAGRQEGGRVVPARRRPRRPRRDVRARHVALGGRGGAGQSRGGRQAARRRRQARACGAPYDLALLYLEGQLFPQDFARAAELFRAAAEAGSPEAQYALATLYKEGRGVPKDAIETARLLAAAQRSAAMSTPWSNTPSRCSTAPA